MDLWGRLSNPPLGRLSGDDIDEIVQLHSNGASISSIAASFDVHRTTIHHHLDRRGVHRSPSTRKMTDRTVQLAANHYRNGESLKTVADRFQVDARTIAREFQRAGISIRRRRGWPATD